MCSKIQGVQSFWGFAYVERILIKDQAFFITFL